MTKRQIEIDDVLQEHVESAIESVKEELDSYIRQNKSAELPCLNNDLDYSGAIHEIIDGAVPIYTHQVETAWFLYSNELEQAYENAGIGDNPRENNGMAAIYCYIQEQVNEWWHQSAEEEFNSIWNKLKREWLDESVKSGLLHTDTKDRINHYTEADREKQPELFMFDLKTNPYPAYIGSTYWTTHRYWYVNLASFGDYDNSCQVERANFRVLDERFEFIEDVGFGGYGHCAAGFWEEALDDIAIDEWVEFIEMVDSLSDYAALDDEMVSTCEMEAENEAWENWLESDIRSELVKEFDKDKEELDSEEKLDKIDSQDLFELVRNAMEAENEYFYHEAGGGVYLDTKEIMSTLIKLVEAKLSEVSNDG